MSEKNTSSRLPLGLDCFQIFVLAMLCVLIAWCLGYFFLDHLLCWVEVHPGLASWVQAVGSLLAILAAIGGIWWQSSHNKKVQERIQKENNILMSEVCLEMCMGLISIINANESPASTKLMRGVMKSLGVKVDEAPKTKSLERVIDLQMTVRILLSKDLPIELMKSIFTLQKLTVRYKDYVIENPLLEKDSGQLVKIALPFRYGDAEQIKSEAQRVRKSIVSYKETQELK